MAAIRTYYQCEACDFGSFELKDIEVHMQETHTVDIAIETEKVELESIEGSNGMQLQARCSDESDSDQSEVVWSTGAIKLLVSLVRDDYDKFRNTLLAPKHYLWKRISWKMAEKGYHYTHVRCDNKWRSLKKTYRQTKRTNRSASKEKRWKFYDLLDEFLRSEEENEADEDEEEEEDDDERRRKGSSVAPITESSSSLQSPATKKRRKETTTTTAEDRERDRERRHREKMEQMNRFNDLFERFVRNNKLQDMTNVQLRRKLEKEALENKIRVKTFTRKACYEWS